MKVFISICFAIVALAVGIFFVQHNTKQEIFYVLFTNSTQITPKFENYILCPLTNRYKCLQEVRKIRPKFACILDYDSQQIVAGNIPKLEDLNTLYYVPIKSDVYTWLTPLFLPQIALDTCIYVGKILECPAELPRENLLDSGIYVQETIKDYSLEIQMYSETKHQVHLGKIYEFLNATATALIWYNESKTCYGLYRMAVISKNEDDFYKAYCCNPFRKEPLYYLARIARAQDKWSTCLLYTSAGILVTDAPNREEMFVEYNIYGWALFEQHAECLHFMNNFAEAEKYWQKALESTAEDSAKERITKNLNHNSKMFN